MKPSDITTNMRTASEHMGVKYQVLRAYNGNKLPHGVMVKLRKYIKIRISDFEKMVKELERMCLE